MVHFKAVFAPKQRGWLVETVIKVVPKCKKKKDFSVEIEKVLPELMNSIIKAPLNIEYQLQVTGCGDSIMTIRTKL